MGEVILVALEEELKESYLDYAMSVIVGRALPDVRDGLKPVQRRILYAMYEMGNYWNKPYKKCARVVGEVIGKYHPHGDMPVYDALVRMAQDFTMRYPLVDGQGNFGSVDGDAPAAMRYTEARLAKIAHELLADIEKETVEFVPNYDNTLLEPVVLPAKVPNLLINGSSGIAVGMATNIPPHNLSEIIDALIYLLRHPDASLESLLNIVKGPDFPTGGVIIDKEGIKTAYTTGKGIIKIRAKYKVEQEKNKVRLIFTEIPYQVSKAKIVEKIAQLIKEKKIEGISEVRDESDREGIRIVVELKKEWMNAPHTIAKELFKLTPLENTFGIIMLVLVNGKPEVLGLKEILQHFLNWRKTVVIRRTQYDLKKAKEKAHILEGFLKALDNIDEIIEIIKNSDTPSTAKERLISRFNFTPIQAQEILNLRLQRLTALEREKILLEYEELKKAISYYEKILTHEPTLLTVIEEELKEIKEKYGDNRRTAILEKEEEEIKETIPSEDVLILVSEEGYIRKLSLDNFSVQKRGGKGSQAFYGEEKLKFGIKINSLDELLIFTTTGKVYSLPVKKIDYTSKTSKGVHLKNYLDNFEGEVAFLLARKDEGYLLLLTSNGIIKKLPVSEIKNIRKGGLKVINLKKDDYLADGIFTNGKNNLLIFTRNGLCLRFNETEVNPMKRSAEGVIGIKLEKDDKAIKIDICDNKEKIFTITEKGFGKKSLLSTYRIQKRGGKGIITHGLNEKTGKLVAGKALYKGEEILVFSSSGKAIKFLEEEVPELGRSAKGVRLITLLPGEVVKGICVF